LHEINWIKSKPGQSTCIMNLGPGIEKTR